MRGNTIALNLAMAVLAVNPVFGQTEPINPTVDPARHAAAKLHGRDGGTVGTVGMEETPHGVLLHARLDNMPAGTHAVHIHEIGACVPPFTSAGEHLNPRGAKHGFRAVKGPHLGDLPNIHVPASGMLEVEYFHPWLIFADELFDDDGAAIVIHAGTDDYQTDPAGAAGARIACGVIELDAKP